jgi:hypothetical protein
MSDYRHLFEPFDEPTLRSIRSAYRRAWPEIRSTHHDPQVMRNRLVGTLARLAQSGFGHPDHLKAEALKALST